MRKKIRTLAAFCVPAIALAGLLSCGASNPFVSMDADYTEHLERTLDGKGASTVHAQTTNGGITLDGSVGDQVVVSIRKKVRATSDREAREFAEKVQIHVERNGDEIRIYKEHPKPPKNVQVEVDYEIQSPSGVDVDLGTTNGGIRIRGVEGKVDATTTNGSIDLQDGADRVDLRTTNGNIDASVDALGGEGRFSATNGSIDVEVRSGNAPVRATTTNGSVELTLPADFSGRLDARTSNGRVRSDFPITVPAGSPQNRLSGSLGAGGNTTITLRSTNGNVDLKRR